MKNSKSLIRLSAAFMASSLLAVSSVHAAVQTQLLQFEPTPVSPGLAEFSLVGPAAGAQSFVTSPGSFGNGDGNLAPSLQTPGGLQVDTPLNVVAPATAGETIDASGSHFYDVTMSFSAPTGAPSLASTGAFVLLNPSLNLAVQQFTDGFFTMTATDGTVLLTGTVQENSISSPLTSTSSAFQSALVTYTGGAIFTALQQATSATTGSASISMTSLDGPVVANFVGTGVGVLGAAPATINPYDSNGTGVFDVANLPEPSSLGIVLMAGTMGLRRRR
jgi:hypothetical protein